MGRFVLVHRKKGVSLPEAVKLLRESHDLQLESQTDQQLIVSGPTAAIKSFANDLGGWFMAAVRPVRRPPTGAARHAPLRRP